VSLDIIPGRRKFEVRTKEVLDIVKVYLFTAMDIKRETLVRIKYDNELKQKYF
jgi:hypothetical protein